MVFVDSIISRVFAVMLLVSGTQCAIGQKPSTWYDQEGTAYHSPLSGGFLAPQFSAFDLDQDGRNEIISYDRYSGIIQTWGISEDDPEYKLRFDLKIEWPIIHSWMLVRDFDRDGLPDIFTQGLHGIAVYRGILDGDKIVFEALSGPSFIDDSLIFHNRSGGTTNIYHAVTDIPVIEDLDGDGDLDILTFELSGSYLYFYENMAESSDNELDFVLRHNCWGYFVENQFSEEINLSEGDSGCPPPFSVRHAGSTSCLVDYDSDGTMDLLLGDIGTSTIKVLLNDGSATSGLIDELIPEFPHSDTMAELQFFPAAYRIDVDQDSIEDVVVAVNEFPLTDQQGVWWYRATGDPQHPFVLQTRQWLSDSHIDLGHFSAPYFFDVNADGRPDLLVGYQITDDSYVPINKIAYFEALGADQFQLRDLDFESLSQVLENGYRPYLTSGDVDGDSAEDLLIGMSDGSSYMVFNGSAPGQGFTVDRIEQNWAGLQMMSGATPELFDVDGDGDLDVLAGMDNGTIGLYMNTGNPTQAAFESDLDTPPNINRIGNIRTVGSNSLLGRSAPRMILLESDTIIISGSHQGHLYAYRFQAENLNGQFPEFRSETWPRWIGGNGRLAMQNLGEHDKRLIAGNIGGGLTEKLFSSIPTSREERPVVSLSIFPNPVHRGQRINIRVPDEFSVYKIKVISGSGIQLKTLDAVSNHAQISTRDWPPGIYFLEFVFRNSGTTVQKLVVF